MAYTNGKKILQLCGCEAVYTSCEYMMRYLIGFAAENGCVIVDETGSTLYTDKRYIEAAEKLFAGTDVTPTMYNRDEVLKRLAAYKDVGISFDQTAHIECLALEKAGINLVNADEAFSTAMMVKNEWELDNIAKACEIAEDALNLLLPEIKEGMTETEVAALLEYNMRKLGAEGLSFPTIVAFGAHAAVPHHETGLTKLKFGDEILIDFGCKVNGYCSDITRTFLFGDDGKHEDFKKAYASVLKAHNLAQEKITAGYAVFTVNGYASTVPQYSRAIEKVLQKEALTWAELKKNIDNVIPKYDVGGVFEDFGNKSKKTVINALRRFGEFALVA